MTERPSPNRQGQTKWRAVLAWTSFAVLCVSCALSLLLIGFRVAHYPSTDYGIHVVGFHIGRLLGRITLPAFGIQLVAIICGALAYGCHRAAKWGVVGGGIAFFLIGVLWANLSEIFVDDLHLPTRARMSQVCALLADHADLHGAYPSRLTELDLADGDAVLLSDPYYPGNAVYQYDLFPERFVLLSVGPDASRDLPSAEVLGHAREGIPSEIMNCQYDPTNGVSSRGDIILSDCFRQAGQRTPPLN
jgi:hypothetical protein